MSSTNSFNFNLLRSANDTFGIKNGNFFINQVPNFLTPTVNVVPNMSSLSFDVNASSAGLTLFTAPVDRDFVIVGYEISLIKDATCDMADTSINIACKSDGISQSLMYLPAITLTAQNVVVNMTGLNFKWDKGTALTISPGTFTAGKRRVSGTIFGYYR